MIYYHYISKLAFIKDFLKECRQVRTTKEKREFSFNVKITRENWTFYVLAENGQISTKAILLKSAVGPTLCEYPWTQWGEKKGKRWDSELKKFLEREVCKVCEEDPSEKWPKRNNQF